MSVNSWQTETKFNRRDALVALAVALLAAAAALLFYLPKTQSGQLTVVITAGGETVCRTKLADFTEETVTHGSYTLHIAGDGESVRVADSSCPNQDCVHTGGIHRAGQSIVCLPAQVVVCLEGTPAAGQPDVIVG